MPSACYLNLNLPHARQCKEEGRVRAKWRQKERQTDRQKRRQTGFRSYLGWNRLSVLSMLDDVAGRPDRDGRLAVRLQLGQTRCQLSASISSWLEVKGQTLPLTNPRTRLRDLALTVNSLNICFYSSFFSLCSLVCINFFQQIVHRHQDFSFWPFIPIFPFIIAWNPLLPSYKLSLYYH